MDPEYDEHTLHHKRRESDLDLNMPGFFSLETDHHRPHEEVANDSFVKTTPNPIFAEALVKRVPQRPSDLTPRENQTAKNIKRSISSGNVYQANLSHNGLMGSLGELDIKVEDEQDVLRLESWEVWRWKK